MFFEHAYTLHRLAQQRSEDALRAAAAHRHAREARASATTAVRRPWSGLRPRRSTPLPCAEPGVRGTWQVAVGLRGRCA